MTMSMSAAQENPYRLYRLNELSDLPPQEWLIKGVLHQSTLSCLYGQPKTGKSFLALDIAASVATGTPWCGHEVTQGSVVYICSEGARAFVRRISVRLPGQTLSSVPIAVLPTSAPIPDGAEVRKLIVAITSFGRPGLVVVDTVARNFGGGNENAADDMNRFVAGLDAIREHFETTVLAVHHEGKKSENGMRGSSVLLGAMDSVFYLRRIKDSPRLELECKAQKDMREFDPKFFLMNEIALRDGETTCVVRPLRTGANDNDGVRPRTIDEIMESRIDDIPEEPGMTAWYALHQIGGEARYSVWMEESIRQGLSSSTFKRILKKLVADGSVRKEGQKYLLVEAA